MSFEVKVIEDSIASNGVRLTTMQLRYPRFIHSEFMTHRVFSRNAASSRAIPVAKLIEQVRTSPAMPIHWGKNQPGMQAKEENTAEVYMRDIDGNGWFGTVQEAWTVAANNAAYIAQQMNEAGYHKQVVNRILEPFQWMSTIVTATEWSNFFELRCHPDAQPEFQHLAYMMRDALNNSIPVMRDTPIDGIGDASNWHLPYVTDSERDAHYYDPIFLAKLSAARCARVSYLNHDGTEPDPQRDLDRYTRLVGATPIHASPVEHQATPLGRASDWSKNFRGWKQFRETVEKEVAGANI